MTKDAAGSALAFPRRVDLRPPESRMAPPPNLVNLSLRPRNEEGGGPIKHVVQLGFKSVGGSN